MKKLMVLLTISTLSTSVLAQEISWLDRLKNLVGLGEIKEQSVAVKVQNVDADVSRMPSTNGLVDMLTSA